MKKIGIIYGMENTFPPALVDRINAMGVDGVTAEHIKLAGVKMAAPSGYHVHNPDELFRAYDETGDLCMTLQAAVDFDDYFRCYVVGQKSVHVMRYDPRRPHAERYVRDGAPIDWVLQARVESDCLTLCRSLGYDLNTVEFAVEGGVPYAIDFLNPAPDADLDSVGPENFEWIVNAVSEYAVEA